VSRRWFLAASLAVIAAIRLFPRSLRNQPEIYKPQEAIAIINGVRCRLYDSYYRTPFGSAPPVWVEIGGQGRLIAVANRSGDIGV
jgi:hypothetical protein